MMNNEDELVPLSYLLEFAKKQPEYRDTMPIESMLMHYYIETGRGEMAMRLSDEIRNHFMPISRKKQGAISDEQAKEVLTALHKTGVIGIQAQYVGVYRILVDYGGFPSEMTSFCRRIVGLGLKHDGSELEYKSFYQSIQKGILSHSVLSKPYEMWVSYKCQKGERHQ